MRKKASTVVAPIIGDRLEEVVMSMPGCTGHAKDTIIAACTRADNAQKPERISPGSPEGRRITQFFSLAAIRTLTERLERTVTINRDGELEFHPFPQEVTA